ncbi:MAG: N-acetylmuramoyl-L-alanine amidase [Gammaproteobacteria bacterium]|nr:N-acetylmuramoyl-L-alanine amidase [Gammaproteobacteria bacterium]
MMRFSSIRINPLWLWALLLFSGVAAAAADAGGLSQLIAVNLSPSAEVTKLELVSDKPLRYKLFLLDNPRRLVVDLEQTDLQLALKTIDFSQTPIKRVRSGRQGATDLRLVFDLKESVISNEYLLPVGNAEKNRLMVELLPVKQRTAAPVVAEKAAPVVAEKVAPVVAEKAAPTAPEVVAVSVKKSNSQSRVVRSAAAIQSKREIIIAIDAGHGGDDPGAIGHDNIQEKEVVLAIARELERRVNGIRGMRAVMIRDGDYFISLRKRMSKARAAQADLMISIHADSFADSRARGASVYTLSERGATSEQARMLAAKENAADLVGGVSIDDKDDQLASVLLDLSQTATIVESTDIATRVLGELKQVGRLHKRRVEKAGFMVLKSPDVPSILVETAFISNPADAQNLNSSTHQRKLAAAILSGLRSYFSENPPHGTLLAYEKSRGKQRVSLLDEGLTQ